MIQLELMEPKGHPVDPLGSVSLAAHGERRQRRSASIGSETDLTA